MPVVVSFIRGRDRGGKGCDWSVTAELEEEETSSGCCCCCNDDNDDGQASASASSGSSSGPVWNCNNGS